MPDKTAVRVTREILTNFCVQVLLKLDVPGDDARITADVLVLSDLRGIQSHGVSRLRRYVEYLQNGMVVARPVVRTLRESPATALIDAGNGLGHPVSHRAMRKAIQKAQETGAGFVSVCNSSHHGIAGYYAMMALEHDCIGMCLTNADVLVVPTFGRDAMLGTNPIAVAAPACRERPFVMDMATSTVPRGKLENYDREGKTIPKGWATDENGVVTEDAHKVLDNLKTRRGGGLLPLGGDGELFSGYKGYGLALLVDIFSAVLSGAAFANLVYPKSPEGQPLPANLGHFFGAWSIDAFRPVNEFKSALDDLQRRLKDTPKAKGQDRIYIHGEKEYESTELYTREGIPLNPKIAADLKALGSELNLKCDIEI
jgi:L-2-hydroxycarboxylate dehydrogenase (NAD+)